MPDDISYFRKQVSYLKDRIRQLQQQLEKSRILQDQSDELLRFERLQADLSYQFVNLSLRMMQQPGSNTDWNCWHCFITDDFRKLLTVVEMSSTPPEIRSEKIRNINAIETIATLIGNR